MRAFQSIAFALAIVASGAAQARPYPSRAVIEVALNAYEACHGLHNQACDPPLRYRLTRARCESLGRFNDDPGRIICFYWGSLHGRGQVTRLRHDCAYFRRGPSGRWQVDAYPDADMCE